ncbi:MAG: antibiotic biosynthesis monooxygenase [Candidatus Accumulibacter sp.]|uniref:putative quinol monooxygenase n=1 Tax=Accumulibacter sp. TaxID=2053492 RepID=UPI0019D955FE|nr:putative quinol monooxygenase [Accumulibacter sp.]MBE2257733.1 antibiotic biosynthesis monooxygenase [Paracoccaceae bacterium]MCB1941179.1 antibiotic biosynthesis monooxygenase [Accumulibacter sp.]MCP5248762.1 antibiotic biosynthesis monooxygenase [Accumulibacter sp.]
MTIRIMARLTARAGSETALATILRELCGPSRQEGGCLGYEVFHNQDDAREFVTVEQWTDQAAADAHLATPHVAEAVRLASALLAQPPLIHRFRQLA